MNDDELTRKWQEVLASENRAAWNDLARELSKELVNLLYRCSYTQREAEDLGQHAILQLWSRKDVCNIKTGSHLRGWLRKVAFNKQTLIIKQSKTRPPSKSLDSIAELASGIPTPPEHTEAQETMEQVRKAIAELPEDHRAVIGLFYFEKQSCKKIAQILEASETAIRQRLCRARTILSLSKALAAFWKDSRVES